MTATERFFGNNANILRQAVASATNVIASRAYRRTSVTRTGGGEVTLSGDYTGASDATFDVEVVSNTINGTPTTSEPTFFGVGSGDLTNAAASMGVNAQTVTVTLEDAGTSTEFAEASLQGVTIRAASSGAGGNNIAISVDASGLTFTDSDYATAEDISKGENEFTGEAWNFGAKTLKADGTIPTDTARLKFASDPTVYRQYRRYLDGQFVYSFSPAPRRDIDAGTRVQTVTGTRTVTIEQGATSETYTNIQTLYDALSAIDQGSALVTVEGVVAQDTTPGGMAVDDLNVITESFIERTTKTGSTSLEQAAISVASDGTTPTETLRIRCTDNSVIGSEQWRVAGTVTGGMSYATTGVAYSESGYSFTIPQVFPEQPAGASIDFSTVLEDRADGESTPGICYERAVVGAQATDRVFTFEWRPRPADGCPCPEGKTRGGPDPRCLGTDTEETVMATLDAGLKTYYQDAVGWWRAYLADNIETESSDESTYADVYEIETANTLFPLILDALKEIHDELGSVPSAAQTEWDAALVELKADLEHLRNAVLSVNEDRDASESTGSDPATTSGITSADELREIREWQESMVDKYTAWMNEVRVEADLLPVFSDANGLTGDGCWQDYGEGTHWFESLDGLLPIQPGYYYHSARLVQDENGNEAVQSTKEFGIGVKVCEDAMKVGDLIKIELKGTGEVKAYVVGDEIEVRSIKSGDIELGGGQTGTDTLTWSVVASDLGRLTDYSLVTTSPTTYSDSGISFDIEPGGIDFVPGDRFVFAVEGGEFRWRKDSGSWTTADIAASVSMTDGLSAEFTPGEAPSYEVGDTYTFNARAINGIDQCRSPSLASLQFTGSTVISITGGSPISAILIAGHEIEDTATLALEGSDNGFASVPFSRSIAWREGAICDVFDEVSYADYRLRIVGGGGAIAWLWLGTPAALSATGKFTERRAYRMAFDGGVNRSGQLLGTGSGGTLSLEFLTQSDIDTLAEMFEHAALNDSLRFGFLPSAENPTEARFVQLDDGELAIEDRATHFNADDAGARRLFTTLTMTPVVQ